MDYLIEVTFTFDDDSEVTEKVYVENVDLMPDTKTIAAVAEEMALEELEYVLCMPIGVIEGRVVNTEFELIKEYKLS